MKRSSVRHLSPQLNNQCHGLQLSLAPPHSSCRCHPGPRRHRCHYRPLVKYVYLSPLFPSSPLLLDQSLQNVKSPFKTAPVSKTSLGGFGIAISPPPNPKSVSSSPRHPHNALSPPYQNTVSIILARFPILFFYSIFFSNSHYPHTSVPRIPSASQSPTYPSSRELFPICNHFPSRPSPCSRGQDHMRYDP